MTGAEVKAQVLEARRELFADLIAVKGHLVTPYPDDPRWTPWRWFVERALHRSDEAATALAPCVLLTAEEAEKVADIIGELEEDGCVEFTTERDVREALALLGASV